MKDFDSSENGAARIIGLLRLRICRIKCIHAVVFLLREHVNGTDHLTVLFNFVDKAYFVLQLVGFAFLPVRHRRMLPYFELACLDDLISEAIVPLARNILIFSRLSRNL